MKNNKIIVDTSILIDYLRGGMSWQYFLDMAPRTSELFLPTIAIFELFSGKSTKNSEIEKNILDLIKHFTPVELTSEISKIAGELRRDIGTHISPQDYVIAASALQINGKVVTLNTKDFSQIPRIEIFAIPSRI